MLGMPKRYSQLASSTHIPFKSSAVVVDSLKCFTTAGSLFLQWNKTYTIAARHPSLHFTEWSGYSFTVESYKKN